MKYPRAPLAIVVAMALGPAVFPARAAVAVLANRTQQPVTVVVSSPNGPPERVRLLASEAVPVVPAGGGSASVEEGDAAPCSLLPNRIYCVEREESRLAIRELELQRPAGSQATSRDTDRRVTLTVPVMLLVDDEEPAVRAVWERRLRKRLAAASAVFERDCRVRFEAVAVSMWQSDNAVGDFPGLVRDFEAKVIPLPARLAIGFSSQLAVKPREVRLGATRGPLSTHIFLREHAPHLQEVELIEALVHELGHFLGAGHSVEERSVMKPKLVGHRARAKDWKIGFDPLNLLIVNLVADELRTRSIQQLDQAAPQTKEWLRPLYRELAKASPGDPSAAGAFAGESGSEGTVSRLDASPAQIADRQARPSSPAVLAARSVVRAMVEAARENRPLPPGLRPEGDGWTELLVRRAAKEAGRLPTEHAAQAYLLGLGVGLDDSTLARETPVLGRLWREVENDEERAARLAVLGRPTMRARRDAAQHFALSAALTAVLSPAAAETAGVLKELRDAHSGTVFSFDDLQSDLAGIEFAVHVMQSSLPFDRLAASFRVADCLPESLGAGEAFSWAEFQRVFGSPQDDRFLRQRDAIRRRIRELAGHRLKREAPAKGPR